MSQTSQKKLNYKKNKKHQTIWNYMRRNPHFRMGDVMMICDVSLAYLQKYIRELEACEYILLTSKNKKPYSNREYSLFNFTGVAAPRVVPEGLYDPNTNETHVLREDKVIKMPENLPQILEAMIKNTTATKIELAKAAGITRKKLSDWWKIIEKLGVIQDSYNDGEVNYIFSAKRVRQVLKELKNGAYKKDDHELRSLWMD